MQIKESAEWIKQTINSVLETEEWNPTCTPNGSPVNLIEAKALLINCVKKLNKIIEREDSG